MELDEARDVLRSQHRAVLATRRGDGAPQLSPVVVGVDAGGAVTVSTRETAVKVANLRREPRAWLCVLPDAFFGRWVQVEGEVEIVALPAAHEGLRELYRQVSGGEHEDWDEFDAAMRGERRVLLRVHPDRVGPDDQR